MSRLPLLWYLASNLGNGFRGFTCIGYTVTQTALSDIVDSDFKHTPIYRYYQQLAREGLNNKSGYCDSPH